jgi:hypothetical protein
MPIELDRRASFLRAGGDETEWSTAPDDFGLSLAGKAPDFVRLRARSHLWDATNERLQRVANQLTFFGLSEAPPFEQSGAR